MPSGSATPPENSADAPLGIDPDAARIILQAGSVAPPSRQTPDHAESDARAGRVDDSPIRDAQDDYELRRVFKEAIRNQAPSFAILVSVLAWISTLAVCLGAVFAIAMLLWNARSDPDRLEPVVFNALSAIIGGLVGFLLRVATGRHD